MSSRKGANFLFSSTHEISRISKFHKCDRKYGGRGNQINYPQFTLNQYQEVNQYLEAGKKPSHSARLGKSKGRKGQKR